MPSSADAPSVVTGGSFFSWSSSKFRYSGRVEKEILEDSVLGRDEPSITRSSIRRKANSVPATPSTPIASDLGERFLSDVQSSLMSDNTMISIVSAVRYSTSVVIRRQVELYHSGHQALLTLCTYLTLYVITSNYNFTTKQTKPPCLTGKIH